MKAKRQRGFSLVSWLFVGFGATLRRSEQAGKGVFMRYLTVAFCFLVCACGGPKGPFQPFIHVAVVDQEGKTAPDVDTFEVTLSSVLNGNPITDVLEYDVPPEENPLPTDFVVLFSEQVRGQNVEIVVRGLANGESVFTATASATADVAKVDAVARFCGDGTIDADRAEQCDDAALNSDTVPNACRTSCEAAGCGDSVVDNNEECDEGAQNSDTLADACRASCLTAFCGDGAIDTGEQCDNGAQNSDIAANACRTSCEAPRCGDGVTDIGEECDDGNGADNDGCDNDCVATSVIQVATGGFHSCALLRTGSVRCWGSNDSGQLGYGNTENIGDDEFPAVAGDVNVGGRVTQITVGLFHTCALLESGNVRCWGLNTSGQLGYGNTENIGDDELPDLAGDIEVGNNVTQISAGGEHTCALLDTGRVRCWGNGSAGQLGYGNTNSIGDNELPSSVGDIPNLFSSIQISSGGTHTCSLSIFATMVCWGDSSLGSLGYGNIDTVLGGPFQDVSVGGDILQITTGAFYTCSLLSNRDVVCWGDNFFGMLGYGNTNNIGDDEIPSSVGTVDIGGSVSQISAGEVITCALLTSGSVRCWGGGTVFGGLGYGNVVPIGDNETPSSAGDINVGGTVIQIDTGSAHVCALLDTGRVRCWGNGFSGQLGYDNINNIGDNEVPASVGDIVIF